MIYQRFGSENSLDMDIMFFVTEIPDTLQGARELGAVLARQFQEKKGIQESINANIARLENGVITAIFKGIADESNNALFSTYSLHLQDFPNQIRQKLPRNVQAKCERTARVLLSYLTKTKERSPIKTALKGDFLQKIDALSILQLTDYETEESLGNTNTLADFQKTFAFQIGQTLALLQGIELFTKNEIAHHFPDLQAYLNRETGVSNAVLQEYLELFVKESRKWC
ncbi:MAG: hypothetical protein ACKVTZ_18290 [Bacteroidia bacterium]